MQIENDLNYRIIDEFDVSEIIKELSVLGQGIWELNQNRQRMHDHHKETKNIFMYDFPPSWEGIGYPLKKYPSSEKLEVLTDQIKVKLEDYFGGRVGKAFYINLPAGKKVDIHKDYGYYLNSVHRCHIPIITNDFVKFFLNGQIINMKAGVCYEINNFNPHAVVNKGETDRIHLLMDIIPFGAFK